MKLIHHNRFVEFSIDEQASIINDVWTIKTAEMSEAEFKQNLKMWRNLCIHIK